MEGDGRTALAPRALLRAFGGAKGPAPGLPGPNRAAARTHTQAHACLISIAARKRRVPGLGAGALLAFMVAICLHHM